MIGKHLSDKIATNKTENIAIKKPENIVTNKPDNIAVTQTRKYCGKSIQTIL